jgi:hypothetical protein
MSLGVNIIGLLAQGSRPLTREIFGNVPRSAQILFYVVAAAAVGLWRVRDIAEMLAEAVLGPESSMGGTP